MRPCVGLAVLGTIGTAVLAASAMAGPPSGPEIEMLFGVKLAMRDGVHLAATLFKPREMPAPLPVVFTLTPYNSDSYYARAAYFARHGYVFALVDVRGRGNSEGEFMPFENEARDGHDVVEALARHPLCNGKVAMWGGSYAGFDQWSTAKELPEHLATIVPAAAAAGAVDFPFFKNVSMPYLVQWATLTGGRTVNWNLFGDAAFWIGRYQDAYRRQLAFRELDSFLGHPSPWFQKTVAHPRPDAYWKAMNPSAEQFAALRLPILTITGHYDDDQPGALWYYREHMKHGSAQAKADHFLIVGPWDHAGTRTPLRDVGGLRFGEKSLVDLNALHKEWYDFAMMGGPRPSFLQNRVAYYVVGADEWKYADSLEAVTNARRVLFLGSDGRADDVSHTGQLAAREPAAASAPDGYTYDPNDLRPAELEAREIESPLTDERYLRNTFGNGVLYTSAPFADDTELSGSVRFTAYIKLDVPDTDFKVSLYELPPDGGSVLLTEDLLRARYRESLERETLVPPGQVLRYEFDGFPFFSRLVKKGSRLRLFLRSPNSIFLQKNYNSGKPVAEETAADARVAHVTLYHDAAHPSALDLPIGR
jgi:putative CocE/NonD family hydrolase